MPASAGGPSGDAFKRARKKLKATRKVRKEVQCGRLEEAAKLSKVGETRNRGDDEQRRVMKGSDGY